MSGASGILGWVAGSFALAATAQQAAAQENAATDQPRLEAGNLEGEQDSLGPSSEAIRGRGNVDPDTNDILVTGVRALQRTSIELKRNSTLIVDGLVGDEIGALPDNSVADALERIPGVAADRFKGFANDLTVRGLGPTLSFATFNGREVSNAGPDRSVSFQQFPSELVSGIAVYKTQQADFLDGGVAGVVALRSIRPLDYGKRLLRAEFRTDYQPKGDDVIGEDGLGYRASLVFSDAFSTGLGEVGIAIGFQRQDTTAPEDYYTGNATLQPCNTSALNPGLLTGSPLQQTAVGANQNCALTSGPRTVGGIVVGEGRGDVYFANSSRVFRAQRTVEVRDAIMGALQWRPAPTLDISLDGQWSKRASTEERNNLVITEGLRGLQPLVIGTGDDGHSRGALVSYRGNSFVENQLEDRQRDEDYVGVGVTATWRPGRWTASLDGSYSASRRTERQRQTRLRSTGRAAYTLSYVDGSAVPQVDFGSLDVTDPVSFLNTAPNSAYARNRFATDRRDRIWALRADVGRRFDGLVDEISVGFRFSDRHRTNDNARNADRDVLVPVDGLQPAQLITRANQNCRAPFTSSSWMDGRGTNLARWATFDNDCLFRTFTGGDRLPYLADGRDPSDIDVRERIWAAYAMASFSGVAPVNFTGNAGVRWVDTNVRSIGYRQSYIVTIDPGADTYSVAVDPAGRLSRLSGEGGYRYLLPSLNLAFDLMREVKLRVAGYRALARSGIESFGAGITLSPSTGTGSDAIIFNATTGNPELRPLRAWNADVSLEWYPSRDTLLSVAGYYKWITGAVIGGLEPRPTDITVTTTTAAPGGPRDTRTVTISPVAPTNDPDRRTLYGVEATVSHAFRWLPRPLDGFGVTATAARTFTDLRFPDTSPVAAYVDPASLFGLSDWIASGSLWYERDRLSLRSSYTYRSDYFKPNGGTNRSVVGSGSLDLALQYAFTSNVLVNVQALNVTGTGDVFYKGGRDSIAEVSDIGPQYFLGVRLRF